MVVEILENALEIVDDPEETTSSFSGNIMESLSSTFQDVKTAENLQSSETITCKRPLKGLGDQLKAEEDAINEEQIRHPPVEKKNRLTDLVKNSKQILSKLILNESSHRMEMNTEKLIRVVDLDTQENRYKLKQIIDPENVPLPPSDSCEILNKLGDENKMEEIELANSSLKNDIEEIRAKTMTFPLAGPSGPSSSFLGRYRTLKFPNDLKHKKWNFGTKIINYIKKKGLSKRGETKPSNGIEITPKEDI